MPPERRLLRASAIVRTDSSPGNDWRTRASTMSGQSFSCQEPLVRIGPAALAACVASLPLMSAGCKGPKPRRPRPRPGPGRGGRRPGQGRRRTGHHRGDRQLPGRRVLRRRPGELGPGHRDAGRRRASTSPKGAVLIRIQAVDANLRLDESRAAVAARRSQPEAGRVAERAGADHRAAQRGAPARAASSRRPRPTRRGRRRRPRPNSVLVARASLAQVRAQLALAEKAVADVVVVAPFAGYISQRRVARRRVRAAVDRRRHAASHRSAPAPADHPERPGRQVAIGQTVTARVDAFPGKVVRREDQRPESR